MEWRTTASIAGVTLGLLSFSWNVWQHFRLRSLDRGARRREYAIKAFERDVVKPIEGALDTVDLLMDCIERAIAAPQANDRRVALEQLLSDELQRSLSSARRRCREADTYLKILKQWAPFEKSWFGGKLPVDDIFAPSIATMIDDPYRCGSEAIRLVGKVGDLKAGTRIALTKAGLAFGEHMEKEDATNDAKTV